MSLMYKNEKNAMQECDPNHTALILAIEKGKFDNASEILKCDDENKYVGPLGVLQITALQMAAWQGNINLLNQLLKKGANINSKDKIGRCALYYAAYRGKADVTKWLLEHGAHIDIKICSSTEDIGSDEYIKIQSGYDPLNYRVRLTRSCPVGTHLPIPYFRGRTPLHYAVEMNHADVVDVLVESGAYVNVEDENDITPLLLAGHLVNCDNLNKMTKFVKIVDILVKKGAFVDAVHPDTGNTALHHAVMQDSEEATQILLSEYADPKICNNSGNTPFHIAAERGNITIFQDLSKKIPDKIIDICNKKGETALHKAVYHGHREIAQNLIIRGANLAAVTETGDTVINAIFDYISQPLDFLTDVLNSCVINANSCIHYTSKKHMKIKIDFSILVPEDEMQMAVITAIIAAASDIKQLAILQHPVVETFLRLKWEKLRIFFFLLTLIHLFFAISLSFYGLMFAQNDADHAVTRRIVAFWSCIFLFYNTIQVILEPKNYLRQLEIWLSLICAILSLITSIAGEFVVKCSKEEIESRHCMDWVLHFISIAILLNWMQMMLLISRVLMWGDYALMFYTVLKNILKVLLAFSSMIIGFALSFAVSFHGNDRFDNFWRSIIKTMVMMMGEYEYEELFDTKNSESTFLPVTSRIVFIVFIMLANIVLINLMIGLAVNDIQGLEKEGHIRRLKKQAEFVAHLERVMSHRIFRSNWLHHRLRSLLFLRCNITSYILLFPERHFYDWKIPVHVKEALFLLTQKSFKNNYLADKNTEIDNKKLTSILYKLEIQVMELRRHCYNSTIQRL
ncbi:transient receptor potential channel pyrexia-like [Solenopsis invicta]|uniref:transient receptor potential channel pyrexia n=1 Tax=Solenopsis invicta TaxID=13686 RepID=UPI00193D61FE|nr:transient receptor potential channel pyrexia [Solenopsis invicta]XP_039315207.1 transient receptor potential channel pyrexia-like [Solenopsis invicta]